MFEHIFRLKKFILENRVVLYTFFLFWENAIFQNKIYIFDFPNSSNKTNLSNPNQKYTGESGRRSARMTGGAVLRRTGRRRVDSPRRQPPCGAPKTLSWMILRKHEQTKLYVNRRRINKFDWSAVDNRLIAGLFAGRPPLFVPSCGPVNRSIDVSINSSHARYVRKQNIFSIPNVKPLRVSDGEL